MTRSVSITRRLIVAVLVLELLSAVVLISAITLHERRMQTRAFEAYLRGTAELLMGAVQDAEDAGDNVILDTRGLVTGRDSVYLVKDERGRVLGAKDVGNSGPESQLPELARGSSAGAPYFQNVRRGSREYRFIVLHGIRTIDPGEPKGGVTHSITVVYGAPLGHIWHEVIEAVRFFIIATTVLISVTAAVMAWLVRRVLSPVYGLAREAERISSTDWRFDAPRSAKNVVELRPLAAALEAALARLRRSFEQQKRFTSDAAHELKTDVAIVKSSLQLLSMRKRTAEEYSHGLLVSLNDFSRLETTVQKMLTLARVEQSAAGDSSESRRQSCLLAEVMEEAVHQSRAFAELNAVRIDLDFASDVSVRVSRHDAFLLCSNILLNALQHSPAGSVVCIGLCRDRGQATLTVQDHGEGIAEEDRPYIFDPFYRGDPSRSRKSGGTGLGLSICKAICERAGGSITVANNAAGGAIVTVTLPVVPVVEPSELSAALKAV